MSISNNMLKNFRADLELATKDLAKKHGLVIDFGAMTYNETQFTFKTTATLGDSKEDVEKTEFEKYAFRFDVKADDYGKVIDLQGKKYKLVGIKPRSMKMPFVVECITTGKRYKVSNYTMKFKLNNY